MGRDAEKTSEEDDAPAPDTPPVEDQVETDEETTEQSAPLAEEKPKEDDEEKKEKVDELRKVIKVNDSEEKSENKKEKQPPAPGNMADELEGTSREALEQKRAVLQSIKDFDFQIKKNSEEITTINKKIEGIVKDLDDLVSLYEIVSEQMNPFVGLSKVTKKRIEALENFTKEVEDLKNRMNDVEAFAENAGAGIKNLQESGARKLAESDKDTTEKHEKEPENIDLIIEKMLSDISLDAQIDNMINEFIENLKDVNVN